MLARIFNFRDVIVWFKTIKQGRIQSNFKRSQCNFPKHLSANFSFEIKASGSGFIKCLQMSKLLLGWLRKSRAWGGLLVEFDMEKSNLFGEYEAVSFLLRFLLIEIIF